ncbi:MAG: protein jag [Chloroflexi bacterium]|nr:protein jag [Chloroflexota bacterium]
MSEKSRDARPSADYSGKTVDEALKRASSELGLTLDELDYQVIKETSRTVLGLVRTGEAIVRVWLPVSIIDADLEEAGEVEPEATSEAKAAVAPSVPPAHGAKLEHVAEDLVSELLDKMGLLAAVEVSDPGGVVGKDGETSPLVLNIVGDDLGMLIGRRGETLRDLQFLVRLMISRKIGSWPNLLLDVEGYKARRESLLRGLAERMAEQVKRTGNAVTLEPMPAHERRIIHLALHNDPDVYTESTGEDEERKVQILLR